tara:strand:+ start:4213 stop:5232 length:1020 start_codon:yes stop_codon:yes gene_type:complete
MKCIDPYIIAEISANHKQDWDHARKLVEAAIQTGVSAIKTQAYTPDSMTINSNRPEFLCSSSLWAGRTLYDIFTEGSMPNEWQIRIKNICDDNNVDFICSAFDFDSLVFLKSIDCKRIKIASSEANDINLIRHARKMFDYLYVSVGMASEKEINAIYSEHLESKKDFLTLFKCTASYPAPLEDINIATIMDMVSRYECFIGLSDHTLGIEVPILALGAGAKIFEKHITLDRNDDALDSKFSLEPEEFSQLVSTLNSLNSAIGKCIYGPTKSEETGYKYRRSIYSINDINKGQIITAKSIKCIRPANGLEPHFYDKIIGKIASRDIEAGTPLEMQDIIWK